MTTSKPIRVFIDLSSGAIHEVVSDSPVEVLIIDDDLECLGDDTPRLQLPNNGALAGYFHYRLETPSTPGSGFFGIDPARTQAMFDSAAEAADGVDNA